MKYVFCFDVLRYTKARIVMQVTLRNSDLCRACVPAYQLCAPLVITRCDTVMVRFRVNTQTYLVRIQYKYKGFSYLIR